MQLPLEKPANCSNDHQPRLSWCTLRCQNSTWREGHQMSSLWGENDRDLAHVGGNMQFSTSSPATGPRVSRMLVAYSPHEINLIVWPWVNVKLMNKMQNNNSMCKRNSAMIPIPIRQRIHLYIPVRATWFPQKQPVLHFVLVLTQTRDFWGILMATDTLLVCGTKTGCV